MQFRVRFLCKTENIVWKEVFPTRLIDIAKLAGVSKATASRALADSPLVRESTKRRVQEIAAQYNYQPNTLARAVASQRSGILGFCLLQQQNPSFGHTFFGPVLDGALQEAQDRGYHMIIAANTGSHTFDEAFIKDAIEGVILSSFNPAEVMREFERRGTPRVLVNNVLEEPLASYVMDDNIGGARMITEHLLRDCGRKRIAIVSDRLSHTSYLLRYLTFSRTLEEAGLQPYANDAFRADDLYQGHALTYGPLAREFGLTEIPRLGTPILVASTRPEYGYQAGKRLLATGDLPDAIFATTDSIAVGLIHALLEAGVRIPEDIAIAGYDGVALSNACFPGLTTIEVDHHAIGRTAAQALLRRIEDPQLPAEILTLPNRLVIRGSTVPGVKSL